MSSLARDYQEKRDFIRMHLSVPATLTLDDGSTYNLTCVDLSSSGAQLQHSSPLPMNANGRLSIQSGGGATAPLIAEVSIQRVNEIANRQYSIGLTIKQYL